MKVSDLFEATTIRLGGGRRSPDSPSQRFMSEITSASSAHPFNHRLLILGGASIEVWPVSADRVRLSDIVSLEPGNGHGSAALDFLTGLADDLGVTIELTAKAYTDERLTTKQLRDWYSRKGFQVTSEIEDGFDMERKPIR